MNNDTARMDIPTSLSIIIVGIGPFSFSVECCILRPSRRRSLNKCKQNHFVQDIISCSCALCARWIAAQCTVHTLAQALHMFDVRWLVQPKQRPQQSRTTGILNYPIKVNCDSFAIGVYVYSVFAYGRIFQYTQSALLTGHTETRSIYIVATLIFVSFIQPIPVDPFKWAQNQILIRWMDNAQNTLHTRTLADQIVDAQGYHFVFSLFFLHFSTRRRHALTTLMRDNGF